MITENYKTELFVGSEVERRAFYMDKTLTDIVIPDGVTVIGESAFQGCSNLQTVKIPKSVVCIKDLAFDCKQLRQQLRNSRSFEPVDLWVPDWSTLPTLEYAGTRSAWNKIDKSPHMGDIQITFANEVTRDYRPTLKAYNNAVQKNKYSYSDLRTIVIPDGVTKIEKKTFYWCCNLISVKIPSTVTEICACAFAFCRNLREIQIPDDVKYICDDAFRNCDNLTKITIPSKVESIGNSAFMSCTKLQQVVAQRDIIAILTDFPENSQSTSPSFPCNSKMLLVKEDTWEDCSALTAISNVNGATFNSCRQGSNEFLRINTLLSQNQAIKINVAPAQKDYDYKQSRFMGSPLIPLSWKEKAELKTLDIYENDAFWFQVNFAELSWIDGTDLPAQGYLYVFINLKDFAIHSYYYDGSEGDPSCVIDGFNEGLETYGLTQTSYPITFSPCGFCEDGMKLLGSPVMGEHSEKKLFLQYDPLDSPMDFLKEVDGYGYIFITEDSLNQMDFFIERS